MITKFVRTAGLLGLLLVARAPDASAASQKEIDNALKGGTEALKARYGRGAAPGPVLVGGGDGIGPVALAGLALIEAGVPVTDPAVKTITEMVRDASYKQHKTYQVALCLMYLDRYGDPADVPLIQMLGVRLLVGQGKDGGWGYDCTVAVPQADEQRLRAGLKENQLVAGNPPAGGAKDQPKLHPEVEKYGQALANARNQPGPGGVPLALTMALGDNSNTQFALLAVWMARKYGVPVEDSLDRIEKRFMATQVARTGSWPYSGPANNMPGVPGMPSSPSMYCAGLLGMATALARRDERQPKNNPPGETKPDAPPKPDNKPNDPFYNPPSGAAPPPKPGGKRPADDRDRVVQLAFAGLGLTMADQVRGRGLLVGNASRHGDCDLYYLWSLERVGVIYGVDKIGGIDWYDVGSTALVRSQSPDGSWNFGTYGAEVNTAFAVLFLSKSNLARDLSNKVQKNPTSAEMRAGTGPSATDLLPNRPSTSTSPNGGSTAIPAPVNLSNPTGDAAIALASTLLKSTGSDWTKQLGEARDGKGPNFTRALVLTAENADGDRKKEARDALAERLCRMTAATLRGMLKANEVELRRAAALACAMKDDKDHIPDLIGVLTDSDEGVARAAKAGLKSLTGKDFGPAVGASATEKAKAVAAWKEWYAKEKK